MRIALLTLTRGNVSGGFCEPRLSRAFVAERARRRILEVSPQMVRTGYRTWPQGDDMRAIRAEACPNIVLETLVNGAVSVSTDHPPMPEFFGDTAGYYRERDARHLAAQVGHVLALSAGAREERRQAARARVAHFTWKASARATLAELQRAVGAF